MIYWIKEKATRVHKSFNQAWMNNDCVEFECMENELAHAQFLGTQQQAKYFIKTWNEGVDALHYLPGNTDGSRLYTLLGEHSPFVTKYEGHHLLKAQCVHLHCAFVNELKELCGFMLLYNKDKPSEWLFGVLKNTHRSPKDRWIILISSLNLNDYKAPDDDLMISSSDACKLPITHEEFPLIHALLQKVIIMKHQTIHPKTQRISQLLRTLQFKEYTQEAIIDAPTGPFLNWDLLFADNKILDLIIKYDIPLSTDMLLECMNAHSQLSMDIRKIVFVRDEAVNKNYVRLLIGCYEQGVLYKHRAFLTQTVFRPLLKGFVFNEDTIAIIPLLIQKNCTGTLFHEIIYDDGYACYVKMLYELGYGEDVLDLFSNSKKREQLSLLEPINDKALRQLGLIFWVRKDLDGFSHLIKACEEYPLLAETLVDLEQKNKIHVDSLYAFALNSLAHQRKSIAYHFPIQYRHPAFKSSDLKKLDAQELSALTLAWLTLKKTGIKNVGLYVLCLQKNKQGQLMRLFLPELGKEPSIKNRTALLDVFIIGLKNGALSQAKALINLKDKRMKADAYKLCERFKCINQLLKLGLNQELIDLAVEGTDKSMRFRSVILMVEEQCKRIHEALRRGAYSKQQIKEWQNVDTQYRRALYRIAFDGLTKSQINVRARINKVQQRVLDIVDPEIHSILYKAFIVVVNLLITLLTLGKANDIKEAKTGNCWFFNQTMLGEQVRRLGKDLVGVMDKPVSTH